MLGDHVLMYVSMTQDLRVNTEPALPRYCSMWSATSAGNMLQNMPSYQTISQSSLLTLQTSDFNPPGNYFKLICSHAVHHTSSLWLCISKVNPQTV